LPTTSSAATTSPVSTSTTRTDTAIDGSLTVKSEPATT